VIVPLVPVIVTVYVAAIVELQLSVAVAVGGTVTLPGVIGPQVRFAGTVSVKVTVPEKVPIAATVMVELADVPTVTAAGEVAVRLKSVWLKTNVAMVEWDSVPLVPVIVTV
jgi:Ca2+-dependent lipid-binding protein